MQRAAQEVGSQEQGAQLAGDTFYKQVQKSVPVLTTNPAPLDPATSSAA